MNQLAAIPSPTTAAWQLGPLTLRAYALCIILGILVACWVAERRMRSRGAQPFLVLDVAIWAVPAGIIGARIYSLITSPQEYFGKDAGALEAFEIWHGGLGIWGGVAGGVLGGYIACRLRNIPLSFVADAAAPAIPLAQAIGRWGNWFNNELYGRPTDQPWGLTVHQMDTNNPGHALVMDGQPVVLGTYQPTFLYEALWDVGVAVLVWLLDRKYRFGRGRAFAVYVMAYTVGRFWIEALRVDDANHILGMRVNSWVSILVFLGALIYFLRVRGPRLRLVYDESGAVRAVPESGSGRTGDGVSTEEPSVAPPIGDHDEVGGTAEPGGRPADDAEPAADPAAGEAAAGEAAEEVPQLDDESDERVGDDADSDVAEDGPTGDGDPATSPKLRSAADS